MNNRALFKKIAVGVLLAAVLALLPLGMALAQGDAGSGSQKTFLPYVFAVYTITWVAFFAFAFYMSRRQRELRREIDELRQQRAQKQS